MELIINILFLPSFYFKAVACIKRKWFIEFRGIKINVEGVPEWTKWVSMLGVTARFSCVGLAVTKHYKQENKSKSTEILIFKMILSKKILLNKKTHLFCFQQAKSWELNSS